MSKVQQHMIRKVAFDLVLDREEGAYAVQDRWVSLFSEKVVPRLSEVFDENTNADTLLRIDQLEVDLGRVGTGMNDRELVEAIISRVAASVADRLTSGNGHVKVQPMSVSRLEALVFFLQTGRLPVTPFTIDVHEEFRSAVKDDPDALWKFLTEATKNDPRLRRLVAERMVRQMEERDIRLLLENLAIIYKEDSLTWLPVFLSQFLVKLKGEMPQIMAVFYRQFIITALRQQVNKRDLTGNILRPVLSEVAAHRKGPDFLDRLRKMNLPKSVRAMLEEVESGRTAPMDEKILKAPEKTMEKEAGLKEGIYCQYAGIVLLHPFIPAFFKSQSLLSVDGKSFKGEIEAEQGMYWLHFLATGKSAASEPEMTLFKLLCGRPVTWPVSRSADLPESGREEAAKLLKAAIGHWDALKNTSPDGLREAFLQREGKLQKTASGYLLQLDKRTEDILLNRLPWGLSVVKFPWMKETLWVEWIG